MTDVPTENLIRADGSPLRVLVIDDEQVLVDLLASALHYGGWEVITVGTGIAAVRSTQEIGSDVIVLDIMLPGSGGLEVIRRVHGHRSDVPVLSPTVKDTVKDRVAGLTAGSDDYVTRPFSLEEVMARLRALLRRSRISEEKPASILKVGDLCMDEDSHEVWRDDDKIQLTATEFELLCYLMRNPRRVLSESQILDRVWSYDFDGQINIVELYISYLRRKIDKGHEPMIYTMRGVGYVPKPAAGTDERG